MPKILKIVLIISFLLLLIAVYLLFFKKGNNNLLYKVPKVANSVIIIDARALSSKLFLDDIGTGIKTSSRIAKLISDSLKNFSFTATGLGLPDKIALFTIEDTTRVSVGIYFILPVSNAGNFHLFMDSVGSIVHFKVNENKKVHWVYLKEREMLVAWDNYFIVGTKTSDNNSNNLERLVEILSTPKEKSVMSDTSFVQRISGAYDILMYSKPYVRYANSKLKNLNSNIIYVCSLLHFNKGQLSVCVEIKTKSGSMLDKVFSGSNREMAYLANSQNSLVNICFNIDPQASRQLYHTLVPIDFKTNQIPSLMALDGRLNLVFNGSKTMESNYITYEYDDDFKKVTVQKSRKEQILDIQAAAGVNGSVIDSLYQHQSFLKDGKDTLLFKGGNFVLKTRGDFAIVCNRQFGNPLLEKKKSANNVEIFIDYKRLNLAMKDLGFENQTRWLNLISCDNIVLTAYKKKNIFITTNINFTDKKKNAFTSILNAGISYFALNSGKSN